jgi:hypothetical protein
MSNFAKIHSTVLELYASRQTDIVMNAPWLLKKMSLQKQDIILCKYKMWTPFFGAHAKMTQNPSYNWNIVWCVRLSALYPRFDKKILRGTEHKTNIPSDHAPGWFSHGFLQNSNGSRAYGRVEFLAMFNVTLNICDETNFVLTYYEEGNAEEFRYRPLHNEHDVLCHFWVAGIMTSLSFRCQWRDCYSDMWVISQNEK